MIYRRSSKAIQRQDYREQVYATPIIPGGENAGAGATVYKTQTPWTMTADVVGLELALGGLIVGSREIPTGAVLLVQRALADGSLELKIYHEGELIDTQHKIPSEAPSGFNIVLKAGTALLFAVTSHSTYVEMLSPLPRSKLGEWTEQGGVLMGEQLVPRTRSVLTYTQDLEQIDETALEILPGDVLIHVAMGESPQPTGTNYALSNKEGGLSQRLAAIDKALVAGGLIRTSPAIITAETTSESLLEIGTTYYRLDDGLATLELALHYEANARQLNITLEVSGQSESLVAEHNAALHISGHPNGLAMAVGRRDSAAGLCVMRDVTEHVHYYTLGDIAPQTCTREPLSGAWFEHLMAYVVPGGRGTLVDRKYQMRHLAGPFLFGAGGNMGHSRMLTLSATEDVVQDTFTSVMVDNKVHTYAVVGKCLFDERLSVLIQSDLFT